MPTTVMWFEIVSYVSLTLQLIVGVSTYPKVSHEHGEGIVFAIIAGSLLMGVFLIWSAARRRKNWARWLLLIFLGLGVLSALPTMADDFKSDVVSATLSATALLLDGVAVYLLFSPGAQPWFAKIPKPARKTAEDSGIVGGYYSWGRILIGILTLVVVATLPLLVFGIYDKPVSHEIFRAFAVGGFFLAVLIMGSGERPA